MKAACSHCGMEHVLKDAEVAAHKQVQFQCSKCRQTTLVEITLRPDQTMVISPLPSFARGNASASSLNFLQQDDGLKLPATKSVCAPPCCKMAPSFVSATASFASRWSLNSASTPEGFLP